MSTSHYRVRFAPSPTGYLHVGGARTALYNYLFAKHFGGKFILRIEDTDQARSTEESLKMVLEDLVWLGLAWDEGPDAVTRADVGPVGPYRQSTRLEIYKKVADELIASGRAYYCFMTDAELEKQRSELMAQSKPPHVNSPYADWSLADAKAKLAAGEKAVVRFKTRGLQKDYVLKDLVRDEVRFPSDMVGDFVLLRSDGMPVYNFCCVVDDHLMKITHVFRAEEHLPNSLRQMMIYQGMGWELPQFGHLSLVLDEDRQKLSKRKGATSCNEFKNEGFLPEALKNFIALLGWSHPEGKEILSTEEMVQAFTGERLNPAGAVFDIKKLRWMNAQHLRALPHEEIWKLIQSFLARENFELPSDPAWQKQSISVFVSSMETLADSIELYRPLSDKHFVIRPEADEVFAWDTTRPVLEAWKKLLLDEPGDSINEARFMQLQDQVKVTANAKGKNLFQAIRVAVIGQPHGTELKILVPLMKKSSLIARAEQCLQKMK